MYEAFYNLSRDPFRLLPEPGLCFAHRSCAKAWAYLRYAQERGEGIVVVTGPPGSGKTTLARRLLNELNPAKTVSVRLTGNNLNPTDLLRKLGYSFGLAVEGMDRAMLAHHIEQYLNELGRGQRSALVVIDEAQSLSHQSLEAIRVFTDLQFESRPVLQLFLLGQEDLEGVMSAPGMEQFQQRVVASCRLRAMDLAETKGYMEYRLGCSGWSGTPSVNGPAVLAIYRCSRGIPRHVNKICSRLLLHGCTEEKYALEEPDVLAVVADLREELLAPLDDVVDKTTAVAGRHIAPVYELALVPATPPREKKKYVPHPRSNPVPAEDVVGPREQATQAWPRRNQAPGITRTDRGPRRSARTRIRQAYRLWRPVRSHASRLRESAGQVLQSLRQRAEIPEHSATDSITRWQQATQNGRSTAHHWLKTGKRALAAKRLWPSLSSVGAITGGMLLLAASIFIVWPVNDDADRQLANAHQDPGTSPGKSDPGLSTAEDSIHRSLAASARYRNPTSALRQEGVFGWVTTRTVAATSIAVLDQQIATPTPLKPLNGLASRAGTTHPSGSGDDRVDHLVVNATARQLSPGSRIQVEATDQVASQPTHFNADPEEHAVADSGSDAAAEGPAHEDESVSLDETEIALRSIALLPATAAGEPRPKEAPAPEQLTEDVANELTPEGDAGTPIEIIAEAVSFPATDWDNPAFQLMATSDDPDRTLIRNALSDDDTEVVLALRQQREIRNLLRLGDQALSKDRLLLPEDESANTYYRRVLAVDDRNARALAGLQKIVSRYQTLTRRALVKRNLDKAERYANRALRVDAANTESQKLRNEVVDAIAALEAAELAAAELAALAMRTPEPAPVSKPPPPSEDNFERLMRLVGGD